MVEYTDMDVTWSSVSALYFPSWPKSTGVWRMCLIYIGAGFRIIWQFIEDLEPGIIRTH